MHSAACCVRTPTVPVDFDICLPPDTTALPSSPQPIAYLEPEEEIARGPACWLWDYLRRCGEAVTTCGLSRDMLCRCCLCIN